ncbi:uncharacterized protein ACO6RY_05017 [Pungitius sinensis]
MGGMGCLAEKGSLGLEGCQVQVGLGGRLGHGAHLDLLDSRDLQDLQGPVVHKDSQGKGVFQARLALQGLPLRPVPTSKIRTRVVEKTSCLATLSMTPEGPLFQDLRVPPGLSVHRVPEAQQDRLAHQDRMGNLEPLDHRARWVQRENVGSEAL